MPINDEKHAERASAERLEDKARETSIPHSNSSETPLISIEEIENNKRDIQYLAIHCSATHPEMEVTRERIKGWHLKRGFSDIGYNLLIHRDGTIEKGRDLDGDGYALEETGAHVSGYNSKSIGICWIGGTNKEGDSEDNRTPEQKRSLKRIAMELLSIYPNIKIRGHRDFPNVSKSCPSFDVISWCKEEGIQHN